MSVRHFEVCFLGLRFATMSLPEVVSLILERSREWPFVDVVTPNVDHIVRMNKNPDSFASLYLKAWLRTNDSRVLQLLGRFRGIMLPVVTGSDLAPALLEDPRLPRDAPICVVGGDAAMVEAVRARFELTNIAHLHAPIGLASNPEAVDSIARAVRDGRYRLVFLCVGSPQQEMIAARVKALGGAMGVALCVGAALEFAAGAKRRAPRLMQLLCLEWLFRLLSEPKRLYRRYLIDGPTVFVYYCRDIFYPSQTFVVNMEE